MADAPASPVTLTRTKTATRHKLFVTIPVADLQRSVRFFELLGFAFNPHFTTTHSVCMRIGEDAYAMLLTRERFGDFIARPVAGLRATPGAILAFSVDSRESVDAMVETALLAGGTPAGTLQDLGSAAHRRFSDLDGHIWEVFYMAPAAAS